MNDSQNLPADGMNRRHFLKAAALGTTAVMSGPLAFGDPSETSPVSVHSPVRDHLSKFEEVTIAELQTAMSAGSLNSVSLTRHYLRQIDRLDHSGPALKSVLELNPDALAIAHDL